MNSYSGNICYCIESGTALETGDSLVSRDENYWDNYPDDFNHTISAYEIKMFIGRIFQYGYTGTISTGWRSQNASDADKLAEAMATQILIWETVVGERSEDFEKVNTGGYDAVLDSITKNHPLYSQAISHYNRIVKSVQDHSKLPSFCTKTSGKAKNIELEWNGTNYSAVLTDSNGVLSNYTFSAAQFGIPFSQSGKSAKLGCYRYGVKEKLAEKRCCRLGRRDISTGQWRRCRRDRPRLLKCTTSFMIRQKPEIRAISVFGLPLRVCR